MPCDKAKHALAADGEHPEALAAYADAKRALEVS